MREERRHGGREGRKGENKGKRKGEGKGREERKNKKERIEGDKVRGTLGFQTTIESKITIRKKFVYRNYLLTSSMYKFIMRFKYDWDVKIG